ncbi:MAG TPA: hypothetical protein GX708_03855 [Gallicola sp.]|jgi:hypothetical protein|nr:hypothetical protein [Gallicola sp.]
MDQHSWHISEKLYLKHLIAYDKNLSKKDKFKLLTKINKMMYETETTKKDDFLLEKINNIKNNQISFLDNLNLIFEAYSKNLKICFKLYINDEISDEIIGVIEEIIFSNHIMVIVNETAYFLKDMINIHYL